MFFVIQLWALYSTWEPRRHAVREQQGPRTRHETHFAGIVHNSKVHSELAVVLDDARTLVLGRLAIVVLVELLDQRVVGRLRTPTATRMSGAT